MFRILSLIAGLAGATGVSQFPEFSQQYLQHLAGAVGELNRFVDGFDADAEAVGSTREEALQALSGGGFQDARQERVRTMIARSERLSADLEALRDASMVQRALQPFRFTDLEIARAAWADFKPAVPVTATGFGFAAAGFVIGTTLLAALLAVLRWPVRRLRRGKNDARSWTFSKTVSRSEPALRAARAASPALPIGFLTRTSSEPHKIVAQGVYSQVATAVVEPGGSLSGQHSAGGDLVFVCHDGQGILRHDGQARPLEAGELAFVPPAAAWELVNQGDVPMRLFCVEPLSGVVARSDDLPSAAASGGPRLTAPVLTAR